MGVSSPSQGRSSRDPSQHGSQERGPSRDSRAAGCQQQSAKHEALVSSRGFRLPGVREGADAPQEYVCLCRQARSAHSSSLRTPWSRGTPSQLCLLSWPSFVQTRAALLPLSRRGKCPGLSWPPPWALKLVLTWLLQGQGKEGWPRPLQKRKTPGSHTLAQAVPSSRIPFFPLPALKRLLSLQGLDETSPFWLGLSCAHNFN